MHYLDSVDYNLGLVHPSRKELKWTNDLSYICFDLSSLSYMCDSDANIAFDIWK